MLLTMQVSSGIVTWAAVSQIVVGVLVALLLVGVIALLVLLRRTVTQLTTLLQRTAGDISGISRDARTILDDVRMTVSVARREVEHVGSIVHKGADRADHVLALAHRRIRRVDRLLEETQTQVRDLAESAASTVRHLGSAAYLARVLLRRRKKGVLRRRKRSKLEIEVESDPADGSPA
ncbi:MAG: hypothetical protein ACT4R6_05760 [Gemmatimonadaceae bacterium]